MHKSQWPLVSVIVPVYNHQSFVEQALWSIIEQDYGPLEVIVIDDGSTDKSAQIAKSFLLRYIPDAIFIEKSNGGAHSALNIGMRLSRGDYITFLNSDDLYASGRLSLCVEFARRNRAEFIFTGVDFVDDYGGLAGADEYIDQLRSTIENLSNFPTLGFAFLRWQLAISTGNFFISRQIANKVGAFNSYKYVHDWDFLLRALFYTEPLFLDMPLYRYRFHSTNSFKSLANIASYETTEVMRNALWRFTAHFPENRSAPSPYYWPGVFETYVRKWNYHQYLPPRFRVPFRGKEWLS